MFLLNFLSLLKVQCHWRNNCFLVNLKAFVLFFLFNVLLKAMTLVVINNETYKKCQYLFSYYWISHVDARVILAHSVKLLILFFPLWEAVY